MYREEINTTTDPTLVEPARIELSELEPAQVEGQDPGSALMAAAQQGDTSAFDDIVRLYRARVFWHCRRRGLDEDEAADVTQNVFMKVHRWIDRYTNRNAFRTWLYHITETACIDFGRARTRHRSRFQPMPLLPDGETWEPAGDDSDPEVAFRTAELQGAIADAVATLSPLLRTAFELREHEGLRYDEIAERLGCTTGTVKTRIYHARQKLMRKLSMYN